MERKIVEAVNEMTNGSFHSVSEIQKEYFKEEILDFYLRFEGIIGYTEQILDVIYALDSTEKENTKTPLDLIVQSANSSKKDKSQSILEIIDGLKEHSEKIIDNADMHNQDFNVDSLTYEMGYQKALTDLKEAFSKSIQLER